MPTSYSPENLWCWYTYQTYSPTPSLERVFLSRSDAMNAANPEGCHVAPLNEFLSFYADGVEAVASHGCIGETIG